MPFEMKWMLASQNATFTPPVWRLRAANAFQFGLAWAWQSAFSEFCDVGTHPGAPAPLEM
jgi:hypothetical protein